ncbi:MAG: hypothetical protein ACPGO3_09320 [Magnetospiraceae bacterium]
MVVWVARHPATREVLTMGYPKDSLGRHLPSRLNQEQQDELKRTGWRRDGLLFVSITDSRLTWPEREFLEQIGARLYGRRHSP